MKRLLLLIYVVFNIQIAEGQGFNEAYGSPVIVLIETDPWLMVVGSDVPTFALYENGQIIYRKNIENKFKYFEVKLSKDKTQQLIKTFGISDSLMKLPDFIEAAAATDQPTNVLLLNFDTLKEINVYGGLRYEKSAARVKTPTSFLMVYDKLIKYDDNNAIEWLPEKIEVMLTSYSYSPEKPLLWPSGWPGLKDSTTVKRSNDLYSVYLDKKYFADFIKLAKDLKQKQAVEVNGEKFSVSYRLPFPNIK